MGMDRPLKQLLVVLVNIYTLYTRYAPVEDVDAPALLDKRAVVFQPLGERERSLEPPLGVRDPRRARGNVGWYRVPYKIELNLFSL